MTCNNPPHHPPGTCTRAQTHALNAEECHISSMSCITAPCLCTSACCHTRVSLLNKSTRIMRRADSPAQLWPRLTPADMLPSLLKTRTNCQGNKNASEKTFKCAVRIPPLHLSVFLPAPLSRDSYLKTCHSSRLPSQLLLIPQSWAVLSRSAASATAEQVLLQIPPKEKEEKKKKKAPCVTEPLCVSRWTRANAAGGGTPEVCVCVCVCVSGCTKPATGNKCVCQGAPLAVN